MRTCSVPAWGWILWLTGLCLALYARYSGMYGVAAFYNADNLIAEDMYRDLIERGGGWRLWGLSGAAMYVELALYFGVRFLTGSVHAALAGYQTLMTLLFCLSGLFASWPVLTSRAARYAGLATSVCLIPVAANMGGLNISLTLAHSLTVSAAVFAAGLLFRWVAVPGRRAVLVVLAFTIVLMSASDMLFVL